MNLEQETAYLVFSWHGKAELGWPWPSLLPGEKHKPSGSGALPWLHSGSVIPLSSENSLRVLEAISLPECNGNECVSVYLTPTTSR